MNRTKAWNGGPQPEDEVEDCNLEPQDVSRVSHDSSSSEALLPPTPTSTMAMIPSRHLQERALHFLRPCKHWLLNGKCKFESQCKFSHGEPCTVLEESGAAACSTPCAAKAVSDQGPKERDRCRTWVHIILRDPDPDIHEHGNVAFRLVPMLIGQGGLHMRSIHVATGAKLRIRGRGSGHKEHLNIKGTWVEAPVPLMLAITIDTSPGYTKKFRAAVEGAICLLNQVKERFKNFCEQLGCPSNLDLDPMFYIGEGNSGSDIALRDLRHMYPNPHLTPKPTKVVTRGHVSKLVQAMNPGHVSKLAQTMDPVNTPAVAADLGHASSPEVVAVAQSQWWQAQHWQEAYHQQWQEWWPDQQLHEAQHVAHQWLEHQWVDQMWQEQQWQFQILHGHGMAMDTEHAAAASVVPEQDMSIAMPAIAVSSNMAMAMDVPADPESMSADDACFEIEFSKLVEQATMQYLAEPLQDP